jgi:EAL domain-containing protein (putative c-di-GMP-specific phosphodiesterase class I)
MIETGAFNVVYQPIVEIQGSEDERSIVGYEALSRFAVGSPPAWFSAASKAGLRVGLELAAIRSAPRFFWTPSRESPPPGWCWNCPRTR